ncbi:tRNA (N6-threonylcarbamoyladenosine(37)-N6)-methyltransferase TrmO [Sunxiuqinia sp. A32]|uniref:tRNA (N6-threonylcarbamoyladenosine(37)-N6)-methyltransferase TrmO n=1 Tax=Sunxiuqinia sp. A32 TaxID=3461496 RepID=UPI0040465A45
MAAITFHPIGTIFSEHKNPEGTPIQFSGAKDHLGTIEIFPEFIEGLADLDGFSHLILIYYLHKIKTPKLTVKPFMDDFQHGVFATRSPSRPNQLGLSIVRLNKVEANKLFIQGLDILNETPLLDIKPYVPQFDSIQAEKIGWLENNIHKHLTTKDDGRFIK